MAGLKSKVRGLISIFRIKAVRYGTIGFSFFLHTAAGALVIFLPKGSETDVGFLLIASLSLIPIVLFAESLKKMVAYLFIAISALPLGIFLLMASILALETLNNGYGTLKTSNLVALVQMPAVSTLMLLLINWPALAGAAILRFGVRYWVQIPK